MQQLGYTQPCSPWLNQEAAPPPPVSDDRLSVNRVDNTQAGLVVPDAVPRVVALLGILQAALVVVEGAAPDELAADDVGVPAGQAAGYVAEAPGDECSMSWGMLVVQCGWERVSSKVIIAVQQW
jgi:hypothetical protein